jgi:hypothetical protein
MSRMRMMPENGTVSMYDAILRSYIAGLQICRIAEREGARSKCEGKAEGPSPFPLSFLPSPNPAILQ